MEDSIREQLTVAATTALFRKATDVVQLNVGPRIGITDAFLLFSTTNERQLKSVMDYIDEALLKQTQRKPIRREGVAESGWLVMDYGDYMIHGFIAEVRSFYALDAIWRDVDKLEFESTDELLPDGKPGYRTIQHDSYPTTSEV